MSIARFAAISQYFTSTDVNYLDANTAEIETDASGWFASTNCSAVVQSNTHAHTGTFSLQMTSVASGLMNATTNNRYNVFPGNTLNASFWAYTTHAAETATIEVDFYDNTGTYLGFVDSSSSPTSLTQNAFTQVSLQFVVPAGAVTAAILCLPVAASSSENIWIDSILLGIASMGANPASVTQVVPANIPAGALMVLTLFKATHTAQVVPTGWSDAGQSYGGPGGSYRSYFKYAGATESNFTLTLGNSVNFVTALSVYTGVAKGSSISNWTINRYSDNGKTDFSDLINVVNTATDQWVIGFVTTSGYLNKFYTDPKWDGDSGITVLGVNHCFVSLGNLTGLMWDTDSPLPLTTPFAEVFVESDPAQSQTISQNVWVLRPALMRTPTTDPVNITDQLTVSINRSVAISNPVGITDNRTLVSPHFLIISDRVGVTDPLALSGRVSPADRVGITDRFYVSLKSLQDPVGVTDSLLLFKQKVIPADRVGITDSVTVVRSLFRTITANPVGITDALSSVKVPVRTIDLQSNIKVLTVPTPVDIAFVATNMAPQDTDWTSVIAEQVGRYLIIDGPTSCGKGNWDVWLRYGITVRRLCRFTVA